MINNHPIVSVIMPFYNSEKYISEAIESILNQNEQRLELILVNDGSNDRSEQIITSFQDPRIVYIKNKRNLGPAASSNIAIRNSNGKYIARMDSDDISMPQRLSEQIDYLEKNKDINVLGTYYEVLDEENNKRYIPKLFRTPTHLKASLIFNPGVAHPSLMFRRSLFNQYEYDEKLKSAIDYDLYVRAMEEIRFTNLPKKLLIYRVHNEQISTSRYEWQQSNARKIRKRVINQLDIKVSSRELKCHQFVSTIRESDEKIKHVEVESWFKKLLNANKQKKVFEPIALQEVIARRWEIVSDFYIKRNGDESYNLFKESSLNTIEETINRVNIQDIKRKLEHNKVNKVAIFGTSILGCLLYEKLQNYFKIEYFLDNSELNIDKKLFNKKIINPSALSNENISNVEAVLISVMGPHSSEIKKQIKNKFGEKNSILLVNEFKSGSL